jgi:hypothetical protein
MKEFLFSAFLSLVLVAGCASAGPMARLKVYASAHDSSNYVYGCVYFPNGTHAYDVITPDITCEASNLGYLTWFLNTSEQYFYSVFTQNYTTYVSSVFSFTTDRNDTVNLDHYSGNPYITLASNSTSVTGGQSILYRLTFTNTNEFYYDVFHNEATGTHLVINQTESSAYVMGQIADFGNPLFYLQQENYCGFPTIVWAQATSSNGVDFGRSNNISINVGQPCSFLPMQCGDAICDPLRGENITSCPQDCAVTPVQCGNGVCESGETSDNCPNDCGAQLNTTPIIPTGMFPPETRFLAYFLNPLFFILGGIVAIAGYIEYKVKTNGVVFGVVVVGALFVLALRHIISPIIAVVIGIVAAAIVAFFITKTMKGG